MDYLKGILSALTAIIVAGVVPGVWSALHGISQTKATGLAAVAGGVAESVLSPLFWVLAVALCLLLFAASRLGNKPLRIFLFWIPTLTVCSITLSIAGLVTFLLLRFSHS